MTVIAMPCGDTVLEPHLLAEYSRVLLDRVVATYAEAGVPLPARQIWMAGEAVYDCEELVVSLMSLRTGAHPYAITRSQMPPACETFVIATYNVAVVRCIPVPDDRGKPPTPQALGVAADLTAADSYLLIKATCRFDLWNATPEFNEWNQDPGGGMGVEASLQVEPASGGMQAAVLTLSTAIG